MGPALTFLGAVFFGTAATASIAYTIAVQVARLAILSLVSKALAPKPNLAQAAADKLVTVKSAIQPQAFVYGQDMLSGPLIFGQVTGKGNKYLHRLIALTGREIDSFVGFRFDDEDITIGTEIPDANDTVASGTYDDVVVIETELGTSSQTALSTLSTDCTEWTSAHRCRDWSLLYTRMEIKGKNTAFKRGAPQNLRAIVKGLKVYDPRLDSTRVIDSTTSPVTYGAGAHRADDSSTWEWSACPALCLADFLMWGNDDVFGGEHTVGCGEDPARIDWELVAAAADICEQQVVIPPSASPSNTQNRYTCNLTFYADEQRGNVKEMLETAMLGRCIFSGGKWKMWAGAALTSTITLDETYLAGAPSIEAGIGDKERYNLVRGKFVDPDRDYSANAYPEQSDSSYQSADNGIRPKTFDWNACNNSYEAQRNAIVMLRKSRNDITIRWPGNWKCFRIQPGSVCKVDLTELSWSSSSSPQTSIKIFVTEWTLAEDGSGVELVGALEDDTVWTDPAVSDYTTRSPTGTLTPPDEPDVALSDATIHNARILATCYAGIKLGGDGRIYYQRSDGSWSAAAVPSGEWLGDGTGDYYARCTASASPSNLDNGTVDTWEPIDDLVYSIQQASEGTKASVILIEISPDSDGSTVQASATFDLEADYQTPYQLIDVAYTVIPEGGGASMAINMPTHQTGDLLIMASSNSGASPLSTDLTSGGGNWVTVTAQWPLVYRQIASSDSESATNDAVPDSNYGAVYVCASFRLRSSGNITYHTANQGSPHSSSAADLRMEQLNANGSYDDCLIITVSQRKSIGSSAPASATPDLGDSNSALDYKSAIYHYENWGPSGGVGYFDHMLISYALQDSSADAIALSSWDLSPSEGGEPVWLVSHTIRFRQT